MKSRVQRGRRRLAQLLDACCALTLDARGLPIDYTPTTRPSSGSCGCHRLSAVASDGSATARTGPLQHVLVVVFSAAQRASHTDLDAPSG